MPKKYVHIICLQTLKLPPKRDERASLPLMFMIFVVIPNLVQMMTSLRTASSRDRAAPRFCLRRNRARCRRSCIPPPATSAQFPALHFYRRCPSRGLPVATLPARPQRLHTCIAKTKFHSISLNKTLRRFQTFDGGESYLPNSVSTFSSVHRQRTRSMLGVLFHLCDGLENRGSESSSHCAPRSTPAHPGRVSDCCW